MTVRPPPFADLTVGAHRLALLEDGAQAYPAMLEAIASARSTICLETYILVADHVGRSFADALAERARAGVEVSLLYDDWGSSVTTAYLESLTCAGVRVLAYHPLRFLGPGRVVFGRLTHRDHRKILVIDGRVGFTGGLNLADAYAASPDGGQGWRDTHLRIEGPAVAELEALFRRTWRRAGGAPIHLDRYAAETHLADSRVLVLSSDRRRGRARIREAYRAAIRHARERIWITNAYFIPGPRFIASLLAAAGRGVDVRVIVGGTTDVKMVLYATRSLYDALLAGGVRMFEWDGRVLHAKTAVVDGRWATVGSSNLDALSLRWNLEVNAVVRDEAFAAALERMFLEDLGSCREISPVRWGHRAAVLRAVSWGAQLLREWL